MLRARSFTFGAYKVDRARSTLTFKYHVEFDYGIKKTFTDKLLLPKVSPKMWDDIPPTVLDATLQPLLIMLGINYWCVFRAKDIRIEGFTLTKDQANFWNQLYLNGLGEFFYNMQIDFHGLINFPFDEFATVPTGTEFKRPNRSLLLSGAGKDSILSAELLKASGKNFEFFSFAPTPAHERIARLVGANTVRVHRKRDPFLNIMMSFSQTSSAYPSVSTFTFIALLLSELLGYDSIVFSNEKSADVGNLVYKGLPVNHQWCKSTEAEKLINDYIQKFITPSIKTGSLLREYSELEIVSKFVKFPKYLRDVTSCNTYFWLSKPEQLMLGKSYWCRRCPKCVFLFACFSAFLPKKELVEIFGADLYEKKELLPLFRRILGVEGFKPLDCVGEPEEMIIAMHYAQKRGEYAGESAMQMFEENFPESFDFKSVEKRIFPNKNP